MNDDFSQHVLDTIEQQRVHPLPCWVWRLQRLVMWMIIVSCALCAALLSSLLILAALHVDMEVVRELRFRAALTVLMASIPLAWIFLCVFFCVVDIVLLRRQTHAYRYGFALSTCVVVFVIVLVGIGLHVVRFSEHTEQYVERGLPTPARGWMMRESASVQPEMGLLAGQVMRVSNERILVQLPSGDVWRVYVQPPSFLERDRISTGTWIMAQGRPVEVGVFQADWIRARQGAYAPR